MYLCFTAHSNKVLYSWCRCFCLRVCVHLAQNSFQILTLATVPGHQADGGSDLLRKDSTVNVVVDPQRKKCVFVVRKMAKWPQSSAHKRTMPAVTDMHFKENLQAWLVSTHVINVQQHSDATLTQAFRQSKETCSLASYHSVQWIRKRCTNDLFQALYKMFVCKWCVYAYVHAY